MMPYRTPLILAAMCSVSTAAVRSGKAEADWLTASTGYEAGKPVQTGIRLVLDEGWHTYWSNPGEGGMKIGVEWELPEGWKAGDVRHPVPKRFMTGDLPGFGYEGTVVFPVELTPPAGFKGEAKLKGKVSWLTCNDAQCLPGNAELEVTLKAGGEAISAEAGLISEATAKVPAATDKLALDVTEKGETLVLTLTPKGDGKEFDPETPFFPETPDVVDAGAEIKFAKKGDGWAAEVSKSEYLSGPVKELTLVSGIKSGAAPLAITWKSK